MPKNSRKQNNNRGRSASPKSVQQPSKRQNTLQTVKPPVSSAVPTNNYILENNMEVENTPVETIPVNNKGKETEVSLINNAASSSSTMNVDDSSDPTENIIATEDDILAFTNTRPLEKFFAFF